MVAQRVKQLRTSMTDAERKLWYALRSRGIGAKFRRQAPFGSYVADFVSFDAKLIVEVDGGQHADNPNDVIRDRNFAEHGYRVLRFWNNEVLGNRPGVLDVIAASHPSPGAPQAGAPPSPARGEGHRASGA